MISALADNAMGLSCGQSLEGGASLVTVNLAVDFLGSATLGQWVEVRAEAQSAGHDPVLRRGRGDRRRRALRQGARHIPGGAADLAPQPHIAFDADRGEEVAVVADHQQRTVVGGERGLGRRRCRRGSRWLVGSSRTISRGGLAAISAQARRRVAARRR
ncbi:MAG: hotdog domain-containing protein [Caulobacteraceae bacterium]